MAPDRLPGGSGDKDGGIGLGGSHERILEFLGEHRRRSQRGPNRSPRVAARGRRTAVLVGVVGAVALAALAVVIWGNDTASHASSPKLGTSTSKSPSATPAPTAPATSSTRGGYDSRPAATPTKPIRLRLTAARGDSWVEIRANNPRGRILFAGVVQKGKSVVIQGARLWTRFGALGNLDVRLDGRPVHPKWTGTVETVIPGRIIGPGPARTPSG